jgi:serine/threonine protein kinase
VLLARAEAMLKAVEESELVKQNRRSYPTFAQSEVKVGPILGQGGFGIVHEVLRFELEGPDREQRGFVMSDGGTSEETGKADKSNSKVEKQQTQQGGNFGTIADALEDEPHYQVAEARQLMRDRARRNGDARYAVKRVKENLLQPGTDPTLRVQAMLDLAVEAAYLSALSHPNIVKMRATSNVFQKVDRNFFIVMDRLFDTLAVRLKQWKSTHRKFRGGFFGRGADKEELHTLMVERLTVSYDLAAAYRYLHENNIVYRDIRKENVGFDVRGDVKVFDFGLSKTLTPKLKCKNKDGDEVYGYHLTPCTGSIPFMAPEIVRQHPYDTQCDVYSFAILLWEMLALKLAFGGPITPAEYRQRVVLLDERPSIRRDCPDDIKKLLKEAWDEDPQKRPNMKRVAATIRATLNQMTKAPAVRHRSVFMMDRSEQSFRLLRRGGGTPPHNSVSVSTAA